MNTTQQIKNRVFRWGLGFALLGVAVGVLASSVLRVDFDEVVNESEIVFQGTVVSSEVRLLSNRQPMTFVTFKIDELIKGEYPTSTIELGFLGGTINGKTMYISDLTIPQLNEEGVYFVESTSRRLVNPLYGWHQGQYFIKTDAQGNKTVHKLKSDAEYEVIGKNSGVLVKPIVESTYSTPSNRFSDFKQGTSSNSLGDFKQEIKNTLIK
ncbi:hypothetical protein SPBRAN_1654 [uncultured Candidatus Thioglobus sp.]|nr:hypothetical protein SPBRAN_1654 [uncultured Candidatus Thioglobus sp.]